ncbi:MAG: stage III sporulation protein AF [bacterium]|nr:stage III sporulation protein AF [bacterium]MDY4098942.1 stage III sporulation protein AF [Lachnospiraceae bacterium]
MQIFNNWIRSMLILYFLMMIMLYFTAGESYKKFIRFFMGLVLALTLLRPVLSVFGKEEELQESILYESFSQRMEEAQLDFGRMEKAGNEIFLRQYERTLEEQFSEAAEEKLLDIEDITVSMNGDYELEQVIIREGLNGDGETLRSYLIEVYGLKEGQVLVQ